MEHPLRHFFSHRFPRAAHVSCVRKGEPRHRSCGGLPRRINHSTVISEQLVLHALATESGGTPKLWSRNLVATSDLLHPPVIAPNRHCPAVSASVPALISVVVSVSRSRQPGRPTSTSTPPGP